MTLKEQLDKKIEELKASLEESTQTGIENALKAKAKAKKIATEIDDIAAQAYQKGENLYDIIDENLGLKRRFKGGMIGGKIGLLALPFAKVTAPIGASVGFVFPSYTADKFDALVERYSKKEKPPSNKL